MFDALTDPSGAALKNRAANRRWDYMTGEGFGRSPINSLGNPDWDAMFQAMDEAGVSNMADSSVGQKKGMWSGNVAQTGLGAGTGRDNSTAFAGDFSAGVGGHDIEQAIAALRKRGGK